MIAHQREAADGGEKRDAARPTPKNNMTEAGHEPGGNAEKIGEISRVAGGFSATVAFTLDYARIGMISFCTAPVVRASRSPTYTFTSVRMPNSGR